LFVVDSVDQIIGDGFAAGMVVVQIGGNQQPHGVFPNWWIYLY
jgi:hypothetical protein